MCQQGAQGLLPGRAQGPGRTCKASARAHMHGLLLEQPMASARAHWCQGSHAWASTIVRTCMGFYYSAYMHGLLLEQPGASARAHMQDFC
jgi:hypothetical protein